MDMLTRREFGLSSLACLLSGCDGALVSSVCASVDWRCGHFQIHSIYTGTAESLYLIFPDGTSMLLDCGDSNPKTFQAQKFGDKSLPILPSEERRAGEWIARYVSHFNPHGLNVDYLCLSHFHGDHSGSFHAHAGIRTDLLPNGEPYYRSGFALVAETLHFRHAIDRGWPDYNDPLPCPKSEKWMGGSLALMRKVYRYLGERDGLTVEKFQVGAHDQIKMLYNPAKYRDFSTFNLCGNGKVAMKDGTVFDCYATEHAKHCIYNENAMSLGNVFSYGKFRFYTAGDFTASDNRKGMYKGKPMNIENILALACDPVSVAKANHHAAWTCPNDLVAALRPRVWIAPVWWQLQCDKKTMNRLSSRENYAGDRLILPGVMCAERRKDDFGEDYLYDVPKEVFVPAHSVVDVSPGGEKYTVSLLDATDESFNVRKQWEFES